MLLAIQVHNAVVTPQGLVDVLLAPFTVLGTSATFGSGLLAAVALLSDQQLARNVDYGLAVGFIIGAPFALPALVAGLSSS